MSQASEIGNENDPAGSVDARPRGLRIETVMAVQSITLVVAAGILPASLDAMPAVKVACDLVHDLAPNIRPFTRKSALPELSEAFVVSGLLSAIVALLTYILFGNWRPNGSLRIGALHKVLGTTTFGLMIFLFSMIYWNPAFADLETGLLRGRGAAALELALSGRLGLATVGTFLFGLGPLMLPFAFWWMLTRPTL